MSIIWLLFTFAILAVDASYASLPKCTSSTAGGSILESSVSRLPALQPDETWEMKGPFESVIWAGEDGHNIPLQTDGKSAYALTFGWYATANATWLSRAKEIILAWGSTLEYLNEQIQGGEGLAYMTAASEILRASSASSGWSESDTTVYLEMIQRIIAPWAEDESLTRNDFFMNQGFYGNGGAMNVAVFSNNRTMYADIYVLMGRDQAHPMGTLRGLGFMGITSRIQGGADFYTQNSARVLAGYEYWSRYNGGDDATAWEPKEIQPGSGEIYDEPKYSKFKY